MLLCSSAPEAEYPELGVCTGDNVRLREDPGTDGKIIGRADTGTQFVILGEVYRVIPTGKDFADVRIKFGIYQEKARALFGKGTKDEFGNLIYSGFTLRYDDEPVDGPEGWSFRNEETSEEIFFQFGFDDDNKETIVDMILWTAPHAEG